MFKKQVFDTRPWDDILMLIGQILIYWRCIWTNDSEELHSEIYPSSNFISLESRARDPWKLLAEERDVNTRQVVRQYWMVWYSTESVRSREQLSIYTVNGEPLFFQQFDGPFYPTLRILHKCTPCYIICSISQAYPLIRSVYITRSESRSWCYPFSACGGKYDVPWSDISRRIPASWWFPFGIWNTSCHLRWGQGTRGCHWDYEIINGRNEAG